MNVTIRPLEEADLPGVDTVFRLALGTLAGMPAPIKYGGDIDYVRTRWKADPHAAFVACLEGNPVGSIFASNWGSVAIVGPLTVHPNVWDRSIGTRLLEPTMDLLERWGPAHVGLHTVVHSAKHIRLFRKFGFWPRCLIEVMSRPIQETRSQQQMQLFSELPSDQKEGTLSECRAITESIFVGLDLQREIRAADEQELGDTVLLHDDGEMTGFAVCHWGPGTEAGTGRCYMKFGAIRKRPDAGKQFERLLKTCEVLASARGASHLIAGVNTARNEAARIMIADGFHTESVGVAMHRPYKQGYNHNDVYVIDDWR